MAYPKNQLKFFKPSHFPRMWRLFSFVLENLIAQTNKGNIIFFKCKHYCDLVHFLNFSIIFFKLANAVNPHTVTNRRRLYRGEGGKK